MRFQEQIIVRLARGQLLQPIRQSATVEDSAGTVSRLPKAVDCHEQLLWIAPLLGKLAGAGIGFGRARRAIPLGREEREAPRQLQLDLPLVASWPLAQCRRRCKTAVEVTERFEMGGPLSSVLTGLHPLVHCARSIAGGGQMMRQEF